MKNKRGFTLIELLAIIVILAIIAVITVPIILGIIDDAKRGAAVDSAYGFKDSINTYYTSQLVKNPNFDLEDGSYTVSEVDGNVVLTGSSTYTISLSGSLPTGGTVEILNAEIIGGYIQLGDYCINLETMQASNESCSLQPILSYSPEEWFTYSDEGNNKLTVTGFSDSWDGQTKDIVIPAEHDGKIVTYIGSSAFKQIRLTSVVIPDTVTSIGPWAFNYCHLTSVEIPNSVTSIGATAFAGNQLTSVVIPDSVKTIGGHAFAQNKLENVEIPDSVTSIENAIFNNNKLPDSQAFIYARNSDGTIDTSTIVSYGGANKNPVIPEGVTTIGYGAFQNNQLTSVTIPNGVTSIGNYAFSSSFLTSVVIPSSVTSIGYNAFEYNPDLTIKVIGRASRPAGWNLSWNINNYPVTWNYVE